MATTTTKPKTLAAAFLAAQADFPEIPKDATGKIKGKSKKTGEWYDFEYKYASLPAVLRACTPMLHSNGLALTQLFDGGDIVTVLVHESGEEMRSRMPCSAEGLDPQKFGAKITYYRRYALVAMLGIAPDEDVDAAGVDAPETPQDAPREPLDSDADARYLAAVAELVTRGETALRAAGIENADLEMDARKLTVLNNLGHESSSEITHHMPRMEFYRALEETVKAIEAEVEGGE